MPGNRINPKTSVEHLAAVGPSRLPVFNPQAREAANPPSLQPSSDLQHLLDDLRRTPEMRNTVIADAIQRLRIGQILTPSSPDETAQAILTQINSAE